MKKQIGERIGFMLICTLGYYIVFQKILQIGCPIRYLTGINCPGCGMTRAYIALWHGNFKAALANHPLFMLVPFMMSVFILGPCLSKGVQYTFWGMIGIAFTICFLVRL